MTCTLCNIRKARRSCPAASAVICPQCCAEQREEKLDCPLGCEFLVEARRHEKLLQLPPASAPHPELKLTDEFLNRNDLLLRYLMVSAGVAAIVTTGATDADMREAIDAMVQTLKTADSGLIYESKPVNPFAAGIQEKINMQLDHLRSNLAEKGGGGVLRDKDLLGVLVFMARVAASLNNGRRKGRAFISMLYEKLPTDAAARAQDESAADSASVLAPADAPSGLIITP